MTFYKVFISFWCIILVLVTGFLVREYRYFSHQARELSQLKDEYATYVLALKKLMSEYDESARSHTPVVSDQKKKLVNRDFAYLRAQAIAFARSENLDDLVRQLYDENQDFVAPIKPAITKKKKTVTRRKIQVASPTDDLKKLQREPIFALPLDKANFWISSLFGPRKKPDGSWGYHHGVDMAALTGTPVKAAGSGVVIQADVASGYGKTIVIAHNRKFKTRYAHLSAIMVHVGQHVEQGELIGKVGATGNVRKSKKGDGSHLHFEVYVFGKQQNPFFYLLQ